MLLYKMSGMSVFLSVKLSLALLVCVVSATSSCCVKKKTPVNRDNRRVLIIFMSIKQIAFMYKYYHKGS